MPIAADLCAFKPRASSFGRYPSDSMASRTRIAFSSLTFFELFKTREAVFKDTADSRATSTSVGAPVLLIVIL
jgi:hypothetical protein